MVAVALAAAAYRLAQGPVSVGFIAPYIEDALKNDESGYSFLIDDTILTWGGWEKTLEIRVRGLRILNRERTIVATVPEAALDLSGRALFRGMLAPTRLELIGPNARLVRLPDGRLIFGITGEGEGEEPAPTSTVFQNLIRELSGPPNFERPTGFLRQVTITGADLAIYDQPSETIWRGPDTHLNLLRDSRGISGDLSTGILVGDQTLAVNLTGVYDNDRRVANLTVAFDEFEPATLAAEHEAFKSLAPITMPVSGSVSFEVGTEGSAPEAPAIEFDLTAGPGTIALPELFDDGLQLDGVSARGRLEQASGQIIVQDFFASAGAAELTAQGLVMYGSDGPGAILDANFTGLPIEQLQKYWPKDVKPKSRKWIVENLSQGVIRDGKVHVAVLPGAAKDGMLPEDAVDFNFALDGMTVRYMRTLPLITGLRAKGHMTGRGLELTDGVGDVGGLELTEGQFAIPDLMAKPPVAEANLVIKGASEAAMRLLDSEQLGFAAKVGLKPEEVGGQSATRARLVFPLMDGLSVKEVGFAAAANMGGLTMPTQLAGLQVTGGAVQLRANPAGISAGGDIQLNGVPVALGWTKAFGQSDQIDGRYRLSGQIDDAGRAALNIPTQAYLKGPLSGTVEVANRGRTLVSVNGRLDLTGAEVIVPPIHWSKPAGIAGSMDFTLTPDLDGGFAVEHMNVSAEGFEAVGKVDFGPGFSIGRIDLGRLAFGETDVSLALGQLPGGGYDIIVGGASYDLRPNLKAEEEEGPDTGEAQEGGVPLKIEARLGRLIIEGDHTLSDVIASAAYTGEIWRDAEIGGTFSDGKPVNLSLSSGDGVRQLTIESEDAGSVGKGLDIYRNAVGGKLTLSAIIDDQQPSRPIDGRLIVDEFRVVNAPVITRILTIGSLAGIVDLVQGDGIKFTRLDSSFIYQNGVLSLKETRAFGPAVGFSLDGNLERVTKTVDFTGTVVPAYTINTVLGKVPVLGELLLGGEGEGVFAVTFAVKGTLDQPRVSVNPLSALAPGFLRGIVSILTPPPAPAPKPRPSVPVTGPPE